VLIYLVIMLALNLVGIVVMEVPCPKLTVYIRTLLVVHFYETLWNLCVLLLSYPIAKGDIPIDSLLLDPFSALDPSTSPAVTQFWLTMHTRSIG